MRQAMSPVGRVYAVAAVVEALTWLGLLVGMFVKYVVDGGDGGVAVFGRLHGAAFVVYVVVTVVAAVRLRWRWWVALIALLASIPPLTTIVAEWWLRRRGDLARPTEGGRP